MEERLWLHERNARANAAARVSGAGVTAADAVFDLRTWHLSLISLLANIPKCEPTFVCAGQILHQFLSIPCSACYPTFPP